MRSTLDRNTGTKKARGLENRRIARDKKIDHQIRRAKSRSLLKHRYGSMRPEPFSLYLGRIAYPWQPRRTAFPLKAQRNGRPLPQYKDLSRWFKFDLLVMAMHECGFVTFDIHIHPKLEKQWADEGRDPRAEMAERTRKELSKLSNYPDSGWEFAFVVEGWGKQSQRSRDWSNPKQVNLHLHGFAAIYDAGDEDAIKTAIGRACGHGLRGYPKLPRKTYKKTFYREGATYPNYLFKYARRKDERMGYRRDYMSHAATALAIELWDTISGRDEEFWSH